MKNLDLKMSNDGFAASDLFRVEHISKRFGGVTALTDVSLSFCPGEIHALVGENGAGKSTLMKILAGVYRPDVGSIYYKGQEVTFTSPRDARQTGVSIVFQELNLFPHLTVAGNIFVNEEPRSRMRLMDEREMNHRSRNVLGMMEVDIHPRTRVGRLSIGEQQLVEIARAISQQAELVIMDEPNSALTDRETIMLFDILRRLRARGITIIYISHRLEEVFEISDRITVLRDGQHIATSLISETSIPKTITHMIGRQLNDVFPERLGVPQEAQAILDVKGLTKKGQLEPLDFLLRKGEILGFAGLEGCGKDLVFQMLFGLKAKDGGEVRYKGELSQIREPWHALDLGWALIPARRREEGIMLEWSIQDNATLVILDKLASKVGLVEQRKARQTVKNFIEQLNIVTDSVSKRVGKLSGGNQQKVVLAKWLATNPGLMILNDPTRGVDVGSKAEIYQLIHRLAEQGLAILFASSELDEVMGLCDRTIVLYKGRKVFEPSRGEASKEEVLHYVNGSAFERIHEGRPNTSTAK